MSSFQLLIKTRAYFLNNFNECPLQVPESDFTNDNFDEYIRYEFVADGSDKVAIDYTGVTYGYVKIHCYHKDSILSVKLAESVKNFFDSAPVDNNVVVSENGQIYPAVDVGNGYYNSLVMFKVRMY